MRDRLGQRAGGQRGDLTGPNPTDRGKKGSKIHLIVDRNGVPLSVGISGTNTHDSQALVPLVDDIAPTRSLRGPRRRRPGKLHGDKAYDHRFTRRFLRGRQITARIARRGVDSSERLGRNRWVAERTIAWLGNYRHLARRYERKADRFLAFAAIACAGIAFRCVARKAASQVLAAP